MKVLLFANIGTDDKGFYHVGDEAMFLEIYRFYKKRFPKVKLTSLVSKPLYKHLEIEERKGLKWPDGKLPAMIYFFKLLVKTYIINRFKVDLFSPEQKSFIEFINKHDLIHFTGGGNIASECKHWFYYALLVVGVAGVQGKKIILTSQTIGPFSNPIDHRIGVLVLNYAKHISLREYTKGQARELVQSGLKNPRFYSACDGAYFLKRSKTGSLRGSKNIRVGLSLNFRNNNAELMRKAVAESINELKERFLKLEVMLLPHILDRDNNWDVQDMLYIAKGFSADIKLSLPNYHKLAERRAEIAEVVKEATASCDLVISSRYHGVVFALSESVPCIALVDGEYQTVKSSEALKFIFQKKADDYIVLMNKSAPKNLKEKVGELITKSLKVSLYINKKNKALKKRNEKYIQDLEGIIKGLLGD